MEAKPWTEVASDPTFRALPMVKQEAARNQYFDQIIAPQVPAQMLKEARFQFDRDTGKSVREPDAIERSAIESMKPSRLERFGRGFADVAQGLKQGALDVTGSENADAYTAEKTEELKRYEASRGPEAGIDWARMGGNVVATAPAMLIPGAGAATLGARVAAGAAQGAAASGSMFTPEGESKLTQTLIGAGIGAAVPGVIEGVRRAVQNVAQSFRGNVQAALPKLEGEIRIQLQQQGVDFNRLTADVRKSLLDDARKALETGGKLDPEQLARKADIESIGAKGTQASVTRNPKDWRTQQNLRGNDVAGPSIAKRAQDDAAAMTDYLSKLRAQTGGKTETAIETSESAIGSLKGVDQGLKQTVDAAYGTARDHLGRAAPMQASEFSQAANLALDEGMLGHYLPAEVRSILNDVTAGKIPFNVNTAVQIDSVLSRAQRTAGQGSPQSLAIGKVRDALNKTGIADNVGEDAKAAFDSARGLARDRFAIHEQTPALAAAVEDVAPDKFLQKYIVGADVRDMRSALDTLRKTPDGAQSIKDIKGHLFDNLLLKATGSTSLDNLTGTFSGRNFAKALDGIPPEKLHLIFSPTEVDALRTLQRASKYLTEEVPFSDVNHSKTAAALSNLLLKVGSTPMIGKMLAPIIGAGKIGMDWVKDAKTRQQVAELLMTSAAQPGQKAAAPLLPPGNLQRLLPAPAGALGGGNDY